VSEIACRRVREHPLEKSPTARGTRRQAVERCEPVRRYRLSSVPAGCRLYAPASGQQGTVRPPRGRPVPVSGCACAGSIRLDQGNLEHVRDFSSKLFRHRRIASTEPRKGQGAPSPARSTAAPNLSPDCTRRRAVIVASGVCRRQPRPWCVLCRQRWREIILGEVV
jgi:hypothetical protein